MASALKNTDISPDVQKHLVKVYNTLALTVAAASAGAWVDLHYRVGGLMTTIAFIGSLILFAATPPTTENYSKRFGLLMSVGFLKGISVSSMFLRAAMSGALYLDASVVLTALLGTVAVFASFSAAALFAKRRSYLYLGGVCGSAMSFLFWSSIFGMFFGTSRFMFDVRLYVGLAAFIGFVVFDTQVIIEKASAGVKDALGDALSLFIDFVAIFVRLLIILSRNSNERKRSNRNRR